MGVMNATVWLGAGVFFTFIIWPAFSSDALMNIFGRFGRLAGEMYGTATFLELLDRYFLVNCYCGAIALFHLFVDWMYTGKPFKKSTGGLLLALMLVGGLGGYHWLKPILMKNHVTRFTPNVPAAEREEAKDGYTVVKWFTGVVNVFVIAGIGFYTWRLTQMPSAPRFNSAARFRG